MRYRFMSFFLLIVVALVGCVGGGSSERFTLTIGIRQGEGEVTPSVGSHDYRQNTLVLLKATPREGWRFGYWHGDVEDPNAPQTHVVMDRSKTVEAFFVPLSHPLGEPVEIDKNGLMRFEGGIGLDFSALTLPNKATVQVEDVRGDVPLPSVVTAAGPIVRIILDAEGIDLSPGVQLQFLLDEGVSPSEVGVFHKESDHWDYQTSVIHERVITARVHNFSLYGVLQGERVAAPRPFPLPGVLFSGQEIQITTETVGATVYVSTTSGAFPGDFAVLTEPLIMPNADFSIYAVARKENYVASEILRFDYEPEAYTVSGFVHLEDDTPVVGAKVHVGHGFVFSDATGFFEKHGVRGVVLVRVEKEGVSFTPDTYVVEGATPLQFVGVDGYTVQFYDRVKFLRKGEQANIRSYQEGTLEFSVVTPFVEGLAVGDILLANTYDPAGPLPASGLLHRITMIAPLGNSFSLTPAYLEDVIRKGTLDMRTTIPFDALVAAMDPYDFEIVSVQALERKIEIQKEILPGVTASGFLRFLMDLEVDGEVELEEGVQRFEFVVSPEIEVELTLEAAYEGSFAREHVLLVIQPNIPIPLFLGVVVYPQLEFIVGARGALEASITTSLTYQRGVRAGIAYEKGRGWWRVYEVTGEGATVEEPLFVGDAEAEIYAGLKFSALVHNTVGLHAGPYLYGDAEALVRSSPWRWEYRMGAGLKLVTGAKLQVLRIASIDFDFPSINLFHTDLVYGISGRVMDVEGYVIPHAEIRFSSGGTVRPINDLGHWQKHLLSGSVVVTPYAEGYTFEPLEDSVDQRASDIDFFGYYEVSGHVRDQDNQPIPHVAIQVTNPASPPQRTTDASGYWRSTGLWSQTTVRASLEGWAFTPESYSTTQPNQMLDFVGTYTVSGFVRDDEENGMEGVRIQFGDKADPVFTASDGSFSRDGLSGEVTVTPVFEDYVFTPTSQVVTKPSKQVNFHTGYTAAGRIYDLEGVGISGVTVGFAGNRPFPSLLTMSDGSWTRTNLTGVVMVSPFKEGYDFLPLEIEIAGAQRDVNFVGTYTVSGYVLNEEGEGLPNVLVKFSYPVGNVLTKADGSWSRDGLSGHVTITPVLEGYTFDPLSRYVVGPEKHIVFQVGYAIRGDFKWIDRSFIGDRVVEVQIDDGEEIIIIQSVSPGRFHKEGVKGRVKVTPVKEGYFFDPPHYFVEEPMDLHFTAYYFAEGFVRQVDGTPVSGVRLDFHSFYFDDHEPAFTNEEGYWYTNRLSANSHRVYFSYGEENLYRFKTNQALGFFDAVFITGPSSGNQTILYYLVSGYAKDEYGAPLMSAQVRFANPYEAFPTVSSRSDGSWSQYVSGTTSITAFYVNNRQLTGEYVVAGPQANLNFVYYTR